MKAYYINPIEQTVTEIDYTGELAQASKLCGGRSGYIDVANLGGGNSLFVGDEGLMELVEADPNDLDRLPRAWLLVDADGVPNRFLVGPGIWVGYDSTGEEAPPPVSIETARQAVHFLRPAVHESGMTRVAAQEILSTCGYVESAADLKRIARKQAHALQNLMLADRMGELVEAEGAEVKP